MCYHNVYVDKFTNITLVVVRLEGCSIYVKDEFNKKIDCCADYRQFYARHGRKYIRSKQG